MNVNAEAIGGTVGFDRYRHYFYPAIIMLAVIVGSLWALSIDTRFIYLLVYLWFGLAYGVLLQYGRFCMAAAVRDLFAVRVPRMAVGVMIAVGLYAIAAGVVTISGFSTFHPQPVGWHVLIGGLFFGFGFVFSGGCASGSLYKTGEGNLNSALVIISLAFTQAFLVSGGGWFDSLMPAKWVASAADKGMPASLSVTHGWFDIFTAGHIWNLNGQSLAERFGIHGSQLEIVTFNTVFNTLLPVIVILVALYYFYYRKNYLRKAKGQKGTLARELAGIWSMCTNSKNTAIAGIGLGIFAGLHMWAIGALREHYNVFNFGELLYSMGYHQGLSIQHTVFDPGYWYITTQEAQWAGWVLQKLGLNMMGNIFFGLENGVPNPVVNAPGYMSIGIILGAAMLALIRREFKWKLPTWETAFFAIGGGMFMGIGARIGLGCNIGAFFATVTNGDPSGWIFGLGLLGGGYLGVKVFTKWMNWRIACDEGCGL